MPRNITQADRPYDILPVDGSIQSVDEAEIALRELSFILAHVKSLKAACALRLDQVRDDYASQMHIVIDGQEVDYVRRSKQLDAALETFADANADTLFPGKSKSYEFMHGTIGHAKSPDKLEVMTGQSAGGIVKRITEKFGLMTKVAIVLASHIVDIPLDWILRVKFELNTALLKEQYKNKKIDKDQLRKVGLKITAGENKFYAKAIDYPVQPLQISKDAA